MDANRLNGLTRTRSRHVRRIAVVAGGVCAVSWWLCSPHQRPLQPDIRSATASELTVEVPRDLTLDARLALHQAKRDVTASNDRIAELRIEAIKAAAKEGQAALSNSEVDRGRIAKLDAMRSSEARDQRWASAMEESVTSMFADERFDSAKLVGLRCATTLCRVDIEHPFAPSNSSELVEAFGQLAPAHGSGYVAHMPESSSTNHTVIYMAREESNAIDLVLE